MRWKPGGDTYPRSSAPEASQGPWNGPRTTKGILKAARSTARTHHKPVARIPKSSVDRKPKAAGREAKGLMHLSPTLAGTKFPAGLPVSGGHCGWEADLGRGEC